MSPCAVRGHEYQGEVTLASRTLNAFYLVWRDWGFLPEQFSQDQWALKENGIGRVSGVWLLMPWYLMVNPPPRTDRLIGSFFITTGGMYTRVGREADRVGGIFVKR